MGTMNFSIPDDVKEAFNEAFKNDNKSAVVVQLMRRAVEEKQRRKKSEVLLEQMRLLRGMGPTFPDDEIRKAREEDRP
jgi:Arc/MetJ family transcription regulator